MHVECAFSCKNEYLFAFFCETNIYNWIFLFVPNVNVGVVWRLENNLFDFVNRVVCTNVFTIVSIVQHLALHFQQWFVNTVDSRIQDLCILFY